jgi:hypothetical protein
VRQLGIRDDDFALEAVGELAQPAAENDGSPWGVIWRALADHCQTFLDLVEDAVGHARHEE